MTDNVRIDIWLCSGYTALAQLTICAQKWRNFVLFSTVSFRFVLSRVCVFLYSLGPKLRHFWAPIVSWAPRHARKTFIVLAPGLSVAIAHNTGVSVDDCQLSPSSMIVLVFSSPRPLSLDYHIFQRVITFSHMPTAAQLCSVSLRSNCTLVLLSLAWYLHGLKASTSNNINVIKTRQQYLFVWAASNNINVIKTRQQYLFVCLSNTSQNETSNNVFIQHLFAWNNLFTRK